MANDYYQIYRKQVSQLAETMVIKFDVSAKATNRYLDTVGFAIGPDRTTWRYYMNMAGLYHSSNKMMRVQSLDTGEMIDFTTENLLIHRATARGYAYGTSYYNDLLNEFPKQEALILGVLNPVDINEAIAAPEYSVLWMDSTLIESQEDNLKELVQADIIAMFTRWHVEMYPHIDDLYDAGRIIALGPHIPNMILAARERNNRTHRAHSFFIRQHLARYGRLDRYMDLMTLDQQLFFYRNVVHFHKYPGQVDSFLWLVDKVMADRNLPLADHKLIQNEADLESDLSPKIEFLRHELTRQFIGIADTKASIERITEKQAPLATFNTMIEDVSIADAREKMTLSKVSSVQTKVLESNVVDVSDSGEFKIEDTLINYWAYMGKRGTYRAVTQFINPRSGEATRLSALESFILFLYSYHKSHGSELVTVPLFDARRIVKNPLPTTTMLYDLTSKKNFKLNTAKIIRDMIPEVGVIVSTASFYDTVFQVWKGILDQRNLASVNGGAESWGEMEMMADAMFHDVVLDLADEPGQTMSQWLAARGLESLESFDQFEHDAIWADLLSRATGTDLNTTISLGQIQRAMVGVMERLSSYSVHFIREINDEPLQAIHHKWVRPGGSDGEGEGEGLVRLPFIRDMKGNGHANAYSDIGLNGPLIIESLGTTEADSCTKIGLDTESNAYAYRETEVLIPAVVIQPSPTYPHINIDGLEIYNPFEQTPVYPKGIQISEAITQPWLSGLNLPFSEHGDLSKNIHITTLNGINVSEDIPVVDLMLAIPVTDLRGFIEGHVGVIDIGLALQTRWLSGLNQPL